MQIQSRIRLNAAPAAKVGARTLKWLVGSGDRIRAMSFAAGWSGGRDFPAPEGRTFREQYACGRRR